MGDVRELHPEPEAEDGGIIFTRARVQIQPAVEDAADEGQRLIGFWLRATEVDADGGELEDARTAHVPIDVGAMRLMLASVGDYLDSLEQAPAEVQPNSPELIVAPASALTELGRQQRRQAERAARRRS